MKRPDIIRAASSIVEVDRKMTTEIEKLRNALANAAAGLEWCARRDAGRMASPNLHDYPEKWAREAHEALEASEQAEFDVLSIQAESIGAALELAADFVSKHQVGWTMHGGRQLSEFVGGNGGTHEGMTYAKGILAITVADVLAKIGSNANAERAEAAEIVAEVRGIMHDLMCLPDGASLSVAREWAQKARAMLSQSGCGLGAAKIGGA